MLMKKRQYSRVMYFFVKYCIVCFFFLCMTSIAVAEISTDGSLGPKGSLTGPNYQIPDTLGQTRGSNLFHSFDKFNIETGYSATFTGPHSIQNVISRVTGGSPSSIDGLLQCMIPGANLYLINPSGVMFGPNASLDVTGSFHVSTADYLKFSDGGAFYANPNVSSVLSVAEPQAFGFLSSSPAGISAEKAYLQVPEGKTISIIGGEIIYTAYPLSTDYSSPDYMFNAPSVLTAPGGRINIASIASPGEVNLSNLDTGTAKLGAITFSDGAKLSVLNFDSDWNPLSAGNIVIRGGQMLFKNGGMDAYGNPGGTIDIKGESLHLDTYYLYAAGYGDIDHPGTACRIEVSNEFSMTHGSLIDASPFAQGRGGDIRINASYIKLGDDTLDSQSYTDPYFSYYGYVSSTTTGSGRGGDIYLSSTGDMTIQNGFFVSTATNGINGGTGDAGNITVNAEHKRYKYPEAVNKGLVSAFIWTYGEQGWTHLGKNETLMPGMAYLFEAMGEAKLEFR